MQYRDAQSIDKRVILLKQVKHPYYGLVKIPRKIKMHVIVKYLIPAFLRSIDEIKKQAIGLEMQSEMLRMI